MPYKLPQKGNKFIVDTGTVRTFYTGMEIPDSYYERQQELIDGAIEAQEYLTSEELDELERESRK